MRYSNELNPRPKQADEKSTVRMTALTDTVTDIDAIVPDQADLRCIDVTPRHAWYPPVKSVVEYLIAIVLFVLGLPIIFVAAVLIKLTSRGPVFYRQTRQGLNGKPYRIIKMRTMVQNAEAGTGAVWSQKNDPRITPIGKFLRATHIDEFPQLINVLRGEMALIGPRPERPEIAETLEWHIAWYPQRLKARPGITGLAQLRLPPDSDLEGVRDKVAHDLYYIRWMSPWLDMRICLKTGWLLFKTSIKAVLGFARLPSSDRVQEQFEAQLLVEASRRTADEERDPAAALTT